MSKEKASIKITLSNLQLCDLELLLNGGFYPLTSFMTQVDYLSVLKTGRTVDGHLWPVPIYLDITENVADNITEGNMVILQDQESHPLASMVVSDIWKPNKKDEALSVYWTQCTDHWGVDYLFNSVGSTYIAGHLRKINMPIHRANLSLLYTPFDIKNWKQQNGIDTLIGFQTRNPIHRYHFEMTKRIALEYSGNLLIHPAMGETKLGDIPASYRIQCYKKVLPYYPKNIAKLALIPLAMRMAGPKEALLHTLIRKNFGCTHFIIGRDHSGPGIDSRGNAFYSPYASQDYVRKYAQEIGIDIINCEEVVYQTKKAKYCYLREVSKDEAFERISGTTLRRLIKLQHEIPSWMTFPEVAEQLKKYYSHHDQRGVTLFFTGLSGSGKSTIATALKKHLEILTDRKVTLLDGDVIRHLLSKDLSFTEQDRNTHIERLAFIASEINKHRGICICAAISPFSSARHTARTVISKRGHFFEIYLSTPISVCEERDVKGLYEQARKGKIPHFTGISQVYEKPMSADCVIDTSKTTISASVSIIINMLRDQGCISSDDS